MNIGYEKPDRIMNDQDRFTVDMVNLLLGDIAIAYIKYTVDLKNELIARKQWGYL